MIKTASRWVTLVKTSSVRWWPLRTSIPLACWSKLQWKVLYRPTSTRLKSGSRNYHSRREKQVCPLLIGHPSKCHTIRPRSVLNAANDVTSVNWTKVSRTPTDKWRALTNKPCFLATWSTLKKNETASYRFRTSASTKNFVKRWKAVSRSRGRRSSSQSCSTRLQTLHSHRESLMLDWLPTAWRSFATYRNGSIAEGADKAKKRCTVLVSISSKFMKTQTRTAWPTSTLERQEKAPSPSTPCKSCQRRRAQGHTWHSITRGLARTAWRWRRISTWAWARRWHLTSQSLCQVSEYQSICLVGIREDMA